MMGRLAEIETAADRLESLVKSLVEDRARAWAEAERLKKALDEREMEFLQMDEEFQRAAKRFEEECATMRDERADAERFCRFCRRSTTFPRSGTDEGRAR